MIIIKTAKWRKTRRKGNLEVLGNIASGHHQTSGNQKRTTKEYLRRMRKLLEIKFCYWNLIEGKKNCAVPLLKYSKIDVGRTLTNGPEDKKANHET